MAYTPLGGVDRWGQFDGYQYLDSKPLTITAKEHRPAYGSDGDYFSKPNPEEIIERIYGMMSEVDPSRYPSLYSE